MSPTNLAELPSKAPPSAQPSPPPDSLGAPPPVPWNVLKRHSVLTYYVLTLAISWGAASSSLLADLAASQPLRSKSTG
jgi:hypothetical protein